MSGPYRRRSDPDPSWRERAACRGYDPDIFYPTSGDGVQRAAAICATCPVKEPCLAYALSAHESVGVWGGTSERERVRMRRASLVGAPA